MFGYKMMDVVLLGALGCSVALNVVQTQKIRGLTAQPPGAALKGARVPPLAVKTADGSDGVIAPGDLPLVLYFFTDSCQWCERNVENLKAIESQTRGRYQLIGVSLSQTDLRAYGARHGFSFPLYVGPHAESLASYSIKGTPQTVVVSPEGRVMESWTGAYMGKVKESVERALGVRLDQS
jgi:peroxiredoxin